MLKRKGSLASHIVPHFNGRLTEREYEAYQAGMASIQAELSDLTEISSVLREFDNPSVKNTANGEVVGEIVIGKGESWQVRRSLIKLSQSEVVLVQRGAEYGIIERFPETSSYAKTYGANELIQTGNDERLLLQDYSQNERNALHFLAGDLKTRVRELLAEKYPDQNTHQIIKSVSARLKYELNPNAKESQAPVVKQVKGVRV